jgi:CDP-alcohol phosphatidyltransferase
MTFGYWNNRLVALFIFMASPALHVSSFLPETYCVRRGTGKSISRNAFVLNIANGGSSLPNIEGLETINAQVSNTSTLLEQENNQSTTNATIHSITKFGPKATPPGLLRRNFPSVPWHEIPNWLTIIRCLALPVFGTVFYLPRRHLLTSIIFSVASLTDYLDGYLARRWDVTSPFGAFLDPVVSVESEGQIRQLIIQMFIYILILFVDSYRQINLWLVRH